MAGTLAERGQSHLRPTERADRGVRQPDDWPTYQGDDSRIRTTKVAIPAKISTQWTMEPTLSGTPTAAVVAGGVVFVADDNGVVRALDASDGKPK